jgi:hypothetical protein
MTAIIAFIFSPLGRWVAVAGISGLLILGSYTKGRFDGRAAYKAKIEREISNAVTKGNAAKADALREFDATPDGVLPTDDGFRRP